MYRTDDDGNVNLMDNLKQGAELIGEVGIFPIPGLFSGAGDGQEAIWS